MWPFSLYWWLPRQDGNGEGGEEGKVLTSNLLSAFAVAGMEKWRRVLVTLGNIRMLKDELTGRLKALEAVACGERMRV